jgi:predicted esterase
VAIPLAGDQDRRIRRAVRLQIAATASRNAVKIAASAAALCRDPQRREAMAERIAAFGFSNGVAASAEALRRLARRSRAAVVAAGGVLVP